ncbi:hypothetical protein D9758_013470 [Tetrapyrgos nigripes]|uniref:Major facilitator superfamily (MFS) profile domain-containing protein n=1 Tax=Tetrapyrgos nigripes TaxID=182062 RepID=A0A8H5CRJ2_9AGAR|nr:hypothetical protein D9758_013470 [Tetrapyrgos nigripes]
MSEKPFEENPHSKASLESSGHEIGELRDLTIDPIAEKKLRRKLDFLLLPLATLCYTFFFLDRSNIGNAKSAGMDKDIGLHTFDFNIGTCLFYVVYLLTEIPCVLMVKRFGFWLLPLSIVCFGVVTLSSAFIHNRTGFYLTRIFLGFCEAFQLPGLSYFLSRYYRRSELTSRIGTFMIVAGGSAGAFGGLLAAGLLARGKIGSRESWQNIFLVEGIITTGIGLILLFIFPTDPERTTMLTEEERELAKRRIFVDQPDIKYTKEAMSKVLIKRGAFNVTTLCCTWLYIVGTAPIFKSKVFAAFNVSVQGLGIFLPSILRVNYPEASSIRIQILVVPIYITASVVALLGTIGCIKFKVHWVFCLTGALLNIIGYSIWTATDSSAAKVRYAACFLNMSGGFLGGPVVLGWAASNASPDTIRAMVGAVVSGIGGIGSIAGVWAYVQTDAITGYHKGNVFNLSMAATLVVTCIGLFLWQLQENRKRERGERDYRLQKEDVGTLGNLHPSFRFIY